ncbi:MAG: AI-2E family transporter [Anaerolineae bacterium]|nr:AI-2E family transporter [Anaerolineae bacterium]
MKPNIQSRIFFYILFAFSAYWAYLLIGPYIGTVVLAMVTVTVFLPVYEMFVRIAGRWRGMPVVLTIVTIFAVVLLPVAGMVSLAVQQTLEFSADVSQLVASVVEYPSLADLLVHINSLLAGLPFAPDLQLTPQEVYQAVESVARAVAAFLAETAISLSSASLDWVIGLVLYVSLLAALFPNYPRLIDMLRKMSPLSDEMDERYIRRITIITKSMVRGMFVLAVTQGLVMGLFFWLAGVKYASFWTLLSIFMAMLPLGCGVIAVPVGIVHMLLGHLWQGLLVLLGYAVAVSGIQYYLTPRLVAREAKLNSALVLLSVFGGLKLFGFMGLVYGPIIMIFLVTTVEIYLDYYRIAKSATVMEEITPPVAVHSERAVMLPSSEMRMSQAELLPTISSGVETPEVVTLAERSQNLWAAVRRLPQIVSWRPPGPWVRQQRN